MSKITFINCKVFANNKEQNYTDYSVELELVHKLTLDGEKRNCKITMKEGIEIVIQYYDNTVTH